MRIIDKFLTWLSYEYVHWRKIYLRVYFLDLEVPVIDNLMSNFWTWIYFFLQVMIYEFVKKVGPDGFIEHANK